MRKHGTLTKWNADRGFGFVELPGVFVQNRVIVEHHTEFLPIRTKNFFRQSQSLFE